MKKLVFPLFIISCSILMSSCVSVDTTRLSTAPENLSPVSTEDVNIYRSESSVPCEYSEVAILSIKGDATVGNDKLVSKARQKAGQIGANGIIISKFGESPTMYDSEPTAEILAIFENRPCN